MSKEHPRHSNETVKERQDLFLAAIVDSETDLEACAKAGIHRATLYNWIKSDSNDFNARLAEAEGPRGRSLEQKMFAILNWATETPEKYEKILRYPNLLMFALRGVLPNKYGYKLGLSQDDAKRIMDQLMGMKDDAGAVVQDGEALEAGLDSIFGGRDNT